MQLDTLRATLWVRGNAQKRHCADELKALLPDQRLPPQRSSPYITPNAQVVMYTTQKGGEKLAKYFACDAAPLMLASLLVEGAILPPCAPAHAQPAHKLARSAATEERMRDLNTLADTMVGLEQTAADALKKPLAKARRLCKAATAGETLDVRATGAMRDVEEAVSKQTVHVASYYLLFARASLTKMVERTKKESTQGATLSATALGTLQAVRNDWGEYVVYSQQLRDAARDYKHTVTPAAIRMRNGVRGKLYASMGVPTSFVEYPEVQARKRKPARTRGTRIAPPGEVPTRACVAFAEGVVCETKDVAATIGDRACDGRLVARQWLGNLTKATKPSQKRKRAAAKGRELNQSSDESGTERSGTEGTGTDVSTDVSTD